MLRVAVRTSKQYRCILRKIFELYTWNTANERCYCSDALNGVM